MKQATNTIYPTLSLSIVGGFCDAVTFVVVTEMFSAHVTGNFIEFSKDLIFGVEYQSWSKLMVFPVFVLAVMVGGLMIRRLPPYQVILIEGMILAICGITGLSVAFSHTVFPTLNYFLALAVVSAMGLQNAFGKIFSKDLYGSTTVMTGNVTQLALDITGYLFAKQRSQEHLQSLGHNAIAVFGFLFGALAGALGARFLGMASICLPSIVTLQLGLSKQPATGNKLVQDENPSAVI